VAAAGAVRGRWQLRGGGGGGGSAEALTGCDGERSDGMESARGPGARGPEVRAGSSWLKAKECRGG
jgi:hypothetical protein